MKNQLTPRGAVFGAFHYLDATLPEETIAVLRTKDIGTGTNSRDLNPTRRKIAGQIRDAFRLMHWGCPLRNELDSFRLYHAADMADAIAAAYGLHCRRLDPYAALDADYSLGNRGILTWESEESLSAEARDNDSSVFWQLRGFHKEGDRFVRYSLPTLSGLMLIRGDRLVWEVQNLQMCVPDGDPKWEAAAAHFKALGGTRGFLAGEFDWPPAGWVNPISDEAAAAERQRRSLERIM